MLKILIYFLAKGFGFGLFPIIPGTMGTIFSWLSYLFFKKNWPLFFTTKMNFYLISIGFLLGIWICHRTGYVLRAHDHKSIVFDEIIAFWFTLNFLPSTNLLTQFLAFILFRFFDIYKPVPISYIEFFFQNGFGVMFDDLLAAFYTLCVLFILDLF